MKKIIPFCIAACTALIWLTASCGGNARENNDEEQAKAIQDATHEELAQAIADRDSLLGLMNDINADMEQIKELENILSISMNSGEAPSQRDVIKTNIQSIRAALEDRRLRLAQLERKLDDSKLVNRQLRETIESLRAQIDNQTVEIEFLTAQLESANSHIEVLNQQVDSLNSTVSNVSAERDEAQAQSEQLTQELNTVYYVTAGKDELKKHNIVEGGGFLKKSKIMEGTFDVNFFQAADKRYLTSINLHSKKAKILTPKPQGSYSLVKDERGNLTLNIIDPKAFWATSNFLVIQTD